MDWYEISWELRQDKMIKSCGCDGLNDAYCTLKGLYHMSELGVELEKELILEILNACIDGRNRYCSLYGEKKLEYVKLENGKFIWENSFMDNEKIKKVIIESLAKINSFYNDNIEEIKKENGEYSIYVEDEFGLELLFKDWRVYGWIKGFSIEFYDKICFKISEKEVEEVLKRMEKKGD